jgi:hypothetical protein
VINAVRTAYAVSIIKPRKYVHTARLHRISVWILKKSSSGCL